MKIKDMKKMIRAFMRKHYTDERLAELLCHARDGKLAYFSCCCLVGAATADHSLRGNMSAYADEPHYLNSANLSGSALADIAYCNFGYYPYSKSADQDAQRRRRLIPMILAEMKRREKLRDAIAIEEARAEVVAKL